MNVVYDLSIIINNFGLKNYWIKTVLSRYITETYKCFPMRCVRQKMGDLLKL